VESPGGASGTEANLYAISFCYRISGPVERSWAQLRPLSASRSIRGGQPRGSNGEDVPSRGIVGHACISEGRLLSGRLWLTPLAFAIY